MPPQYVKPFVKANKTDYRDAEANTEAAQRPGMRCALEDPASGVIQAVGFFPFDVE